MAFTQRKRGVQEPFLLENGPLAAFQALSSLIKTATNSTGRYRTFQIL